MIGSQEDALKRMSKLVNFLMSKNDAAPFLEPVDWRGLELYDYPQVIERMMDLGTVKRKLDRRQYATAQECAEDIRLIWKNCCTYNADGSDFWLLAKNFSRRFEERYKKIKAECNVGESNATNSNTITTGATSTTATTVNSNADSQRPLQGMTTLDSKAQVASKIFLLSGVELAHVLTTLENQCPMALDQVGDSANIEINIDALDSKTFADIEKYIMDCVSSRHTDESEQLYDESSKAPNSNNAKKRRRS
jgi:Bromodomain/Bromodomain extra-terminal - transcription regulation